VETIRSEAKAGWLWRGCVVWGKGQRSVAPPQYTEVPERDQRFGLKMRIISNSEWPSGPAGGPPNGWNCHMIHLSVRRSQEHAIRTIASAAFLILST